MYPKCSLSDSNIYLQIVGLLSLVIIMIIAWFYYMRVYHTTIMEKYDEINTNTIRNIPANEMESGNRSTFPKDKYPGIRTELVSSYDKQISDNTRTNTLNTTNDKYTLRPCKVYFTSKDNIGACDNQSDDTTISKKTCSYKFDGWQEFATYTDKNGNKIEYPKKTYKPNESNTEELINSYFTSKCFKEFSNEGQGAAQNFVHKENALVKFDSKGMKDNTEVDTNIFGGKRYTSIQFLNSPTNPSDNFNNVIDSICSVKYDKIPSIINKQFYKFKFDQDGNIKSIDMVQLNSEQNGFTPVSNNDALNGFANLGSTGLRFVKNPNNNNSALNDQLEVFIKNGTEKPVNVQIYKFDYVSYLCNLSQIKISTMTPLVINANNFLTFTSASGDTKNPFPNNPTIATYLKNSFTTEEAKTYSGDAGYADQIMNNLRQKIKDRENIINTGGNSLITNLETDKTNKENEINALLLKKNSYTPPNNDTTFKAVVELTKNTGNRERIFDYKEGYRNKNISDGLSVSAGATIGWANATDLCISFPYTGTPSQNNYTTYNFQTTEAYDVDILIVGGGGAGGNSMGGGGGAGGVFYTVNQRLPAGTYTVGTGRGGIGLWLPDGVGQGYAGQSQDGVQSYISSNGSYLNYSLGGQNQITSVFGGGGGGVYFEQTYLNGRDGGSGGGCSESNPHFAVNSGGKALQPSTYWNGSSYVEGGKPGRQNTNSVRDYQGGGGGGLGGQSGDYRNGNNGVAIDITGTSQFYAAGGGAGQYGLQETPATASAGLGGSGIGGNGTVFNHARNEYFPAPRDRAGSGVNGTGSGGGGHAYMQAPRQIAGSGGSGIVIIRIKNFLRLRAITDDAEYNKDPNTTISLANNKFQQNIITAFIFLQEGYYRFKADLGNNGDDGNPNIKYAELMIYDESHYSSGVYNGRTVFKYTNQSEKMKPAYLRPYIYIPKSKFLKLAYRYISYNIDYDQNSRFMMKYIYSTSEPAKDDSGSIQNIISSPAIESFKASDDHRYMIFPYTSDNTGNGHTQYTINVPEDYRMDILIVGGGGAGGDSMGGGGGAGGLVYAINQIISKGTYVVRVGRGGIGGSTAEEQGTAGVNQDGAESSLMNNNGSYVNYSLDGISQEMRGRGGGGGGVYYDPNFVNGRNGGSGGGSSKSNNNGYIVNQAGSKTQGNTYWNGSSYVSGGNNGRQNTNDGDLYLGGGGGGVGVINSSHYSNGNDGVTINITGTPQTYAAGGGSGQYAYNWSTARGLGGSGIGGNGRIWKGNEYAAAPRNVATSGANGTGSGGGGGAYSQPPHTVAGSGGSGIVIIRYYRRIGRNTNIAVSSIKLDVVSQYNEDGAYSSANIGGITNEMTNYIFSGTNLYRDYNNRQDPTIMNIFSTIKYTGNTYPGNYQGLANYLGQDNIDYYGIRALNEERDRIVGNIASKKKERDNSLIGDPEITRLKSLLNSINTINYNSLITLTKPTLKDNVSIRTVFRDAVQTYLTFEKISNNDLLQQDLLIPPLIPAIYIEALS